MNYIVAKAVKERFKDAGLQMRAGSLDAVDRAVDDIITKTIAQCSRFKSVRAEDIDFVANHAGAELIRKRRR